MEDSELLNVFKKNLTFEMQRQGLSNAELSRRAGFAYETRVTAILNGDSLPNMAIPRRLARALGVHPEALFTPRAVISVADETNEADAKVVARIQRGLDGARALNSGRVGLDAIVDWWSSTGGDLSQIGSLIDHVDIFKLPDADQMCPRAIRVGRASLASVSFGVNDAPHLNTLFKQAGPEVYEPVAQAHFNCLDGTMQTEIIQLSVSEGRDVLSSGLYSRSLFRVRNPLDGIAGQPRTLIMNYSKPISGLGKRFDHSLKLVNAGRQKPVFTRLRTRSDSPTVGTKVLPREKVRPSNTT